MKNTFSLATLARKNGRRKGKAVRPIPSPATKIADLQAIIRAVVTAWVGPIRNDILPVYEQALTWATRDAPSDRLRAELDAAKRKAAAAMEAADAKAERWTYGVEVWHRYRWAGGVRAALGVDVFPYLNVADVQTEIDAALARNVSLIKGLSDQVSSQVEQYVWDAVVNKTPRRELGNLLSDRLNVARSRGDFIAKDQTLKLSGNLDQLRQLQAGVDSYIWRTAQDERVRPTHAEREGKLFRWDDDGIKPREEPNCRCTGQAYVDVQGDDET